MESGPPARPRRGRALRWIAAAYLLLLVASWARTAGGPDPVPAAERGRFEVEVPTFGPDARPLPGTTRLAYVDTARGDTAREDTAPGDTASGDTSLGRTAGWRASAPTDPSTERGPGENEPARTVGAPGAPPSGAAPLVLLHGSPGSADDFRDLGPLLARGRRLVVPDLPGFGVSPGDVPDLSARAHAAYVRALLDELGVERCHVLGFSMGGAAALELAAAAPERVRSVTLLASIGV
ncbi:MAG: alpha/beta fold hydrolase, partial [Planctomycetota bacterium]